MIANNLLGYSYNMPRFFSLFRKANEYKNKIKIPNSYIGSGFLHACKGEHGSPSNDRNVHAALSANVSIQ
jgi:hypothetical protein